MNKKILQAILLLLFVFIAGCTTKTGYGLKASLNNPTEYTFDASMEDIEKALAQLASERDRFEHAGVVKNYRREGYGLVIRKHRSEYYWAPNDGTGDLQGSSDIETVASGDRVIVKIVPGGLEQHTGEGYAISPHPAKVMKWKEVETSTFWEYRLLLEIGNLVGQKGMPPINE